MAQTELVRTLCTGWSFREADPSRSVVDNFSASDGWLPASVPGTVYQDLIAGGHIADPFIGRNEEQVQWVAEKAWRYRASFVVAASERRARMALVFEGLDTFAQVWLSGESVHSSDNMFVPARVGVADRLRDGRNELWIHCWPATSWALIDSGAQRKPAWFATRRALAPLACALRFEPTGLVAWAMNGTAQPLIAHAQWQVWRLDGTLAEQHGNEVTLPAGSSVELAMPAGLGAIDATSNVVSLSLDVSAEQARAMAWPEPFRWYRFPDPQIEARADDAGTLLLRAQRPAKGVWLAAPGAQFDDNAIDLMPQQDLRVHYLGSLVGLSVLCPNTVQDAPAQPGDTRR